MEKHVYTQKIFQHNQHISYINLICQSSFDMHMYSIYYIYTHVIYVCVHVIIHYEICMHIYVFYYRSYIKAGDFQSTSQWQLPKGMENLSTRGLCRRASPASMVRDGGNGHWNQLIWEVSINGGTPKSMVYNGKSYRKDDLGVPLFQETSIWRFLDMDPQNPQNQRFQY